MATAKAALSRLKFYCLAYLLYGIVRLVYATCRVRIHGVDSRIAAKSLSPTGGYIFASWHHNTIGSLMSQVGVPYRPLASQSEDGAFISFVLSRFGFVPLRGSSSKGAVQARTQLLKALREGYPVALMVDGPRGPKGLVKPGAAELARTAGVPIVAACAVSRRYWVLKKTWDLHRIPKPFSTVHVYYAAPRVIAAELRGEAVRAQLKEIGDELDRLELKAQGDLGTS